MRLCDANGGDIYRWDGDAWERAVKWASACARRASEAFTDPSRAENKWRMMATKTIVHVVDVAAEQAYSEATRAGNR